MDGQVTQHQETPVCRDIHCRSHGLDENGYAYEQCGHCGHRYRNARELRWLTRRKAFRKAVSADGWLDAGGRLWWLWMALWTPKTAVRGGCVYCYHPLSWAYVPAGGPIIPPQTSGEALEGEVLPSRASQAKRIKGWVEALRGPEKD